MRPIGAWIMGIYSDRKGRKAGLTLSVTLMCVGSLLIAVTPSYESIGVFAPLLLVVARLIQGLSVGGEYGASATYLSEMAEKIGVVFLKLSICHLNCRTTDSSMCSFNITNGINRTTVT